MKKFYLLTTSLFLAATSAFAAQGDNYWYISASFNDHNPNYNDDWALMDDDTKPGEFTGTFTINESSFSFYLVNQEEVAFIPVDLSDFDNMKVNLDFSTDHSYKGNCSADWNDEYNYYYWNCPSWPGGQITVSVITIDPDTEENLNNPIVEIYANPANNDFNTNYTIKKDYVNSIIDVIWNGTIDDVWFEVGTATITDSEGNVTDLVKNISGQPGSISLLDTDPYGFSIDIYSLDLLDGDYTITIPAKYLQVVSNDWDDFLYNPEIQIPVYITYGMMAVGPYWYIRASFNDFNPESDLEKWALMDNDENDPTEETYTGTFDVPAGSFSFNLMSDFGYIFVPVDGDYYGMNEEIVFDNNTFTGLYGMAYDETEEDYTWYCENWPGGQITVSIDSWYNIEIYAFPVSNEYNEDYTLTEMNEEGVITVYWTGEDVCDIGAGGGETPYITNGDGVKTTLTKNIPGQPGQVTIVDSDPYGIVIELASLDLEIGSYTLTIPAKFVEIASDDYDTFGYNPEITCSFTITSSGIVNISNNNSVKAIFNLQGQKMNDINSLSNGIYIINGKKVLIRK